MSTSALTTPQQIQVLTVDQSLQDNILLPGFTLPLATLFEIQSATQSPDPGSS